MLVHMRSSQLRPYVAPPRCVASIGQPSPRSQLPRLPLSKLTGPVSRLQSHHGRGKLITCGVAVVEPSSKVVDDRAVEAPVGFRAVVIGAGLAGLTSARVLADHFDEVLLLDRDHIDKDADGTPDRRGVPQFSQPHVLLMHGADLMEGLLPGVRQEIMDAGATPWDAVHNYYFWNDGQARVEGDPSKAGQNIMIGATRALLERVVRRRVFEVPGIRVLPGALVTDLVLADDNSRVAGVRLKSGETLNADLVVDASGRGSRLPTWLESAGYTLPDPLVINSGLVYGTRVYKIPEGWPAEKLALGVGPLPSRKRTALLLPVEHDQWQLIISGRGDSAPTGTEEDWNQAAKSFGTPELYNAIMAATPVSDVSTYARTENFHRHLEKADLPDCLAVLGDATCCFNPAYGQGMTMGVIGATTLGALLGKRWEAVPQADGEGRRRALLGLTKEFQAKLAEEQVFPWSLATADDLAYLRAEGKLPEVEPSFGQKLIGSYMDLVIPVIMNDLRANERFIRVVHMKSSSAGLFHPDISLKVLQLAVQRWLAGLYRGDQGGLTTGSPTPTATLSDPVVGK